MQHRELPEGWDKDLPTFPADAEGRGGRDCFRQGAERDWRKNVPWLIGGSADLAPSTKTRLTFDGAGDFEADRLRRAQLPFRHPRARDGRDPERHGALRRCGPYGSGFLIFSDYARPAIRLSALMEIPVILHLHARFDRRRRGRADAPADRAAGLAARHSRPDRAAARRRQRSGGGLEDHHAAGASSRWR